MSIGPTSRDIGASQAKSRFYALLRKVAHGERFTITNRGRPVAELAPATKKSASVPNDLLARLMNPPITGILGDVVVGWIREGRR